MPNAYAAADNQHERDMAARDRITAILEAARDDIDAALNCTFDMTLRICVSEAINKLLEVNK